MPERDPVSTAAPSFKKTTQSLRKLFSSGRPELVGETATHILLAKYKINANELILKNIFLHKISADLCEKYQCYKRYIKTICTFFI